MTRSSVTRAPEACGSLGLLGHEDGPGLALPSYSQDEAVTASPPVPSANGVVRMLTSSRWSSPLKRVARTTFFSPGAKSMVVKPTGALLVHGSAEDCVLAIDRDIVEPTSFGPYRDTVAQRADAEPLECRDRSGSPGALPVVRSTSEGVPLATVRIERTRPVDEQHTGVGGAGGHSPAHRRRRFPPAPPLSRPDQGAPPLRRHRPRRGPLIEEDLSSIKGHARRPVVLLVAKTGSGTPSQRGPPD